MLDQANKLRQIINDIEDNIHGTRVCSIISGKGGVGKTKFAMELEGGFLDIGKKVISLDMEKFKDVSNTEIVDALLPFAGYEMVIINNMDGLSETSLKFTKLAHEAILVTMPGVSAITETYKFLKILNQEDVKGHVKILVNNKEHINNEDTFNKLNETTKRFLDIGLEDITDMDQDQQMEVLYNSGGYDEVQWKKKIMEIFG